MFNRFEWKKTETRTMEELVEKFPVQNLIGKKITQLNAIGYGCITSWDVTQPESQKLYCQIEVNEPFVFGFEMMSSKNNVNQIEIVMEPEYMNVFSLEDDWTTIGDEESIEINGKTIEFNLPDLQKWTSEYLWQVLVPCESGEKTIEEINKSFDWKNFHKRGLELAHKVKKLLPKNVRLRYVAPFEDRSGIIDGKMLVE